MENCQAERIVLESTFPGEVHFAEQISGRENVIIATSVDDAVNAAHSKPTARVVLVTDDKFEFNPDEVLEMANNGVSYLVNSGDINELVEKVSNAYSQKKNLSFYILQEEPEITIDKNDKVQIGGLVNNHIIGQSENVKSTLQLIATLLSYNEDILITGENGVGKGVVARTILDNSSRQKHGVLNVAELSSELFASELFGYKRGAFTGAEKDSEGMISKYDGGVLFLDEIGELRLEDQAKLLRVLQDREYRRVGDTETRKFDIQFIFATNQDLEDLIEKDRFREDLFHRISTLALPIAPLRDRKEDIPLLIREKFRALNQKYPEKQKGIASQVIELLAELNWPGNIRQLEKVLMNMHVRERERNVSLATLHAYVSETKLKSLDREVVMNLCEKFGFDVDLPVKATQMEKTTSEVKQSSISI